MRATRELLKRRREERQTYVTQGMICDSLTCKVGKLILGGDVWVDPPNYFDQIVWPAYVKAHRDVFKGGDVEKGEAQGMTLLEPADGDVTEAFEQSCQAIWDVVGGA